MMESTAFRILSNHFARLAVRHGGGGRATKGRQGKSAAFGRAQVVGWIELFCHHVAPACWRFLGKRQRFQQSLRHRHSDASGNSHERT
jgi:hypothetical protein